MITNQSEKYYAIDRCIVGVFLSVSIHWSLKAFPGVNCDIKPAFAGKVNNVCFAVFLLGACFLLMNQIPSSPSLAQVNNFNHPQWYSRVHVYAKEMRNPCKSVNAQKTQEFERLAAIALILCQI